MRNKKNKGQSTKRAIKRGNIKPVIDYEQGIVNLYRRTATSKKHSIYVGHLDARNQIDSVLEGLGNEGI